MELKLLAKFQTRILDVLIFTTASEVATMEFVRNVLRTPAPKVYAWSSKAENPVGAEYIIMEKVAGIQLDQLATKNPGNWTSRDCLWAYKPHREKKLAAIENYLKLVKYILPTDGSITRSCLWHSDLHAENIFVNPSKPVEIVGIIDWQSTDLLPLFDQARQPYILEYDGPQVKGLERLELPEDFQELTSEEQGRAQSLYLQMSLLALYKKLTHDRNERLYRAMEFRDTLSFELLLLAQNLLIDGEAHYQARIADLERSWADLPGVRAHDNLPFPCHFSSGELTAIHNNEAGAIRGMEYMELVKQKLGDLWPEKGIVRHDQYNESKAALRQAKQQIIDQFALDEQERAD